MVLDRLKLGLAPPIADFGESDVERLTLGLALGVMERAADGVLVMVGDGFERMDCSFDRFTDAEGVRDIEDPDRPNDG